MMPLKRGGLRVGQWYLGINRRKAVVWPTRSVVAVLEPGRSLAWDTRSSGARWIWELSPDGERTRVVHRRPVPRPLTAMSKLFAPVVPRRQRLDTPTSSRPGMAQTVSRLKAAAEGLSSRHGICSARTAPDMPWLAGPHGLGSAA